VPPPSWGPGENLTLSDAELACGEPIAAEGGKSLRACCPFHGSDHQRSLRVNTETGHVTCFACDSWGSLQSARVLHCRIGSVKQREGMTVGWGDRRHGSSRWRLHHR